MSSQIEPVIAGHNALSSRFTDVRDATRRLASPLSAEDCAAQSMPDASPTKWHLAHTTWFFETFILEAFERNFRPFHPDFRVLFNSYYNGVGEKHPRPHRGLLTRPAFADILSYREDVDTRMLKLLAGSDASFHSLIELGLQHEQQHQELILTDIKHLLGQNPLWPAYNGDVSEPAGPAPELEWIEFPAEIVKIGHPGGSAFSYDNELPSHRQFLEAYQLASRLVTNGEFLAFIEAGGYSEPSLWLAEGWDWVRAENLTSPLYWHEDGKGRWHQFTLRGMEELNHQAPLLHISYHEAFAYAQWADARLPTEAEWENAASHPAMKQLFGTAWQWTSSSYAPYPGYKPAKGAVGEYNGKFMVNQYVLRGSSLATPPGHERVSYRNFFPTTARWQFSGLRLAK